MVTTTSNNKRIAKNTFLLYFRMLFTMMVSLYTSRVVLATLGVEDFGIYNVVGGVVTMFAIISTSLSSAISRFITIELGKGEIHQLKTVFSTAVTIQLLMALVVVIFAECVGVWFLNNKMNIPEVRMNAANWVLQFSIFTFGVNLICIPFNALIIAHERMSAFAYVSILEVLLKLLIIYLLILMSVDKLIVYGGLLLVVAIIVTFAYFIYCRRHFVECKFFGRIDVSLLKNMLGFSGWNFIGASSAILRDQGVNIIINLFCGPTVNAARGVAIQVNHAINSFAQNFMTALNPQIIKSYAMGNSKYMFTLIFQGARLSFYMLLFLSLPVLMSTDYILSLWLRTVPDYTVVFVRLVLIFAMCESISNPLITAMLATGRIRNYQVVVGGMQMMNFPISYVLLKRGFAPEITLYVAIGVSLCCLVLRLFMLRSMIQLSVRTYMTNVFFNVFIVTILSATIPYLVGLQLGPSFYSFLILSLLCVICSFVAIFFIGCKASERLLVVNQTRKIMKKIICSRIR